MPTGYPSRVRFQRIALVQQRVHEDIESNLERGLAAARSAAAQGARLVAFAELAFTPFYPQYRAPDSRPAADLLQLAEPTSGPTVTAFRELAAELGLVVVLNFFEREGERTFDSSPVIDADGSLLGTTRMVHITDYEGFHEQDYYDPGDAGMPVFDTAVGKVGVAICYDRHYPECMRALALKGAELVVIPQAGTAGEWPDGLYQAELQVAAFQNGYFTALCNRVGKEESLDFAGESFVCSPAGEVLAEAGTGTEETLLVDIDLDETASSHARRLFLRHRRPDLYADWLT